MNGSASDHARSGRVMSEWPASSDEEGNRAGCDESPARLPMTGCTWEGEPATWDEVGRIGGASLHAG
jgi:hypothetical protein